MVNRRTFLKFLGLSGLVSGIPEGRSLPLELAPNAPAKIPFSGYISGYTNVNSVTFSVYTPYMSASNGLAAGFDVVPLNESLAEAEKRRNRWQAEQKLKG